MISESLNLTKFSHDVAMSQKMRLSQTETQQEEEIKLVSYPKLFLPIFTGIHVMTFLLLKWPV